MAKRRKKAKKKRATKKRRVTKKMRAHLARARSMRGKSKNDVASHMSAANKRGLHQIVAAASAIDSVAAHMSSANKRALHSAVAKIDSVAEHMSAANKRGSRKRKRGRPKKY